MAAADPPAELVRALSDAKLSLDLAREERDELKIALATDALNDVLDRLDEHYHKQEA